jgi:uncharacterized protein
LNIVNGDSAEYWAAAKEGRLLFQKCRSCGVVQFPPRYHCGECWSDAIEWIESCREGTIESFTVVHRAPVPSFQERVPYVIAAVRLDEGVRMITNLLGGPHGIRIGERVRVDFTEVDDMRIPQFRRLETAAAN